MVAVFKRWTLGMVACILIMGWLDVILYNIIFTVILSIFINVFNSMSIHSEFNLIWMTVQCIIPTGRSVILQSIFWFIQFKILCLIRRLIRHICEVSTTISIISSEELKRSFILWINYIYSWTTNSKILTINNKILYSIINDIPLFR